MKRVCSMLWLLTCRGFTKFSRDDFVEWKKAGRLVNDGVTVKLLGCHGPLAKRKPEHVFPTPARICRVPVHENNA
jgi:hypothetical protein